MHFEQPKTKQLRGVFGEFGTKFCLFIHEQNSLEGESIDSGVHFLGSMALLVVFVVVDKKKQGYTLVLELTRTLFVLVISKQFFNEIEDILRLALRILLEMHLAIFLAIAEPLSEGEEEDVASQHL